MINSNFLSVDLRANLRADVSCDGYSGEMLRSSGTILVSCSRAANVHLPHQEVKGCKRDLRGYDGGCATPFSQSGPELPFDTPPPLSFGFTEAVVHAYRSTKPNSAVTSVKVV